MPSMGPPTKLNTVIDACSMDAIFNVINEIIIQLTP